MSYKIEQIEGIGAAYAGKLSAAGIATTDDLLSRCCSANGRKEIAETCGVSEKLILKWANMADLMRISGVAGEFAELLEAAGVDTVKELRNRRADSLADKMKQINETKKLTRAVPNASAIENWIAQAKDLEPTITH
ncbi:MAG: DUF4332 domain-containing protein [Planctomycetota bacterium]|jgi:predicted flap endonuclease-1-like 5' DNA nuclease